MVSLKAADHCLSFQELLLVAHQCRGRGVGVLLVTKDEHVGGAGQVQPGRSSLEQMSKTQKIPS